MVYRVPVLGLNVAADVLRGFRPPPKPESWQNVDAVPDGSVGIEVMGLVNWPLFRPGEVLVFAPASAAPAGKFVLALSTGQCLVRQWRAGRRGSAGRLVAVNRNYPTVTASEDWRIVGRLVAHIVPGAPIDILASPPALLF